VQENVPSFMLGFSSLEFETTEDRGELKNSRFLLILFRAGCGLKTLDTRHTRDVARLIRSRRMNRSSYSYSTFNIIMYGRLVWVRFCDLGSSILRRLTRLTQSKLKQLHARQKRFPSFINLRPGPLYLFFFYSPKSHNQQKQVEEWVSSRRYR
jgi:hypothetical protein